MADHIRHLIFQLLAALEGAVDGEGWIINHAVNDGIRFFPRRRMQQGDFFGGHNGLGQILEAIFLFIRQEFILFEAGGVNLLPILNDMQNIIQGGGIGNTAQQIKRGRAPDHIIFPAGGGHKIILLPHAFQQNFRPFPARASAMAA